MVRKATLEASTAIRRSPEGDRRDRLVPALTIVSHPRADRAGERATLDAVAAGREAGLSRAEPDFLRRGSALGSPLLDPFLSRKPIRIAPAAEGRIRIVAEAKGSLVVGGKPVQGAIDLDPEALAAGVVIELAGRVVVLLHLVSPEPVAPADELGMVGDGSGIRRVRGHVERIVDLDVPVLIRGETGTGKELVARAIHDRSPRKEGPFVSVNLGAVPRDLAAAELFGAQRGAFTGATSDRPGYFRAARGGTLFLDEVGEAPPEVQVMLLRVLETGEMYPVGAQTPVTTDVRLIAATDADLEQRIREGRFRAPLLHRLSGYEIRVPPLRERREDIGLLFHHFAREELRAVGEAARLDPSDPHADPWLPASLASLLVRFAWPGNIRQLRNVARQLVLGSRGLARLQIDPRLAAELDPGSPPSAPAPPAAGPLPRSRRKPSAVTEAELVAALRDGGWDLKAAADRLGIPRSSMYDVIDRFPEIRTAGDLGAGEIERCYRECGGDLDAMAARLQVSRRALGRRLRELGLGTERS
jgi:two-component system, NtrC family, nitrogen regulation response regulator GlnG